MPNRGVFLSRAEEKFQEGDPHTRFTISGIVPVGSNLQVRRMPGLQYASPRYHYTPPEPHPASMIEKPRG